MIQCNFYYGPRRVYLPFDNLWSLMVKGKFNDSSDNMIISWILPFLLQTSDFKANKINKKHPCASILLDVKEFGLSMSRPDPFIEEFVNPINLAYMFTVIRQWFPVHKKQCLSISTLIHVHRIMSIINYLPPRWRPRTRDIATPPPPPVCPSVTFSFRRVTRKRINVFSRNFAGTCTMSWGCAVLVFDIDGMLFEFFMNFWNCVFFNISCFLCVLYYFQHFSM